MRLDGKAALVIGGAKVTGKACVLTLAVQGAR